VWLPATRTSGSAFQVKDTWSQVRVSAGSVLLDVYDGPSGVLLNTELVATGQSDVGAISASENYVLLAGGPTRALATYRRSGLTWVSATPPVVNNVSRIALLEVASASCAGCGPDLPYAVIERTTSPQLQVVRIDSFPSVATLVNSGVQGWSYVIRGGLQLVAASVNGDVRLVMGSTSSSYADFNGPPRAGFPSPPAPLDVDVLCEAVYPHLALIEDALVVTWQERCAPQTRWRIATRVIR